VDPSFRGAAGSPAAQLAELPRSCRQAAELLTVIAGSDGAPARSVDEAWAQLAVARAAATVDPGQLAGPLAELRAHDDAHATEYVATLAAWLRHPARPLAAARELHVHVNTLRYRLGRLDQLVHLDLTDATVRLALQLQLAALTRT
jgi:DNA-binding PucR family transcriptional regulator